MGDTSSLEAFLRTDPRDVGCAQAIALLHVYVDLNDAERRGEAPPGTTEHRFPGVAAHLQACGPCGDDFDGLLAAAFSIEA